jgi:hypothetical protein
VEATAHQSVTNREEAVLPLFICPNDQTPMQKVSREGVDIDICPSKEL